MAECVKCSKCGREIKNVYTFKGESYGKVCFGNVIEEYKSEKKKSDFEEWSKKCDALVLTLERKDLSNITNNFKLDFIPSIIKQYREKDRLSKKQYNLAKDMLNKKDTQLMTRKLFEFGVIDKSDFYYLMHIHAYNKDTDFWWDKYNQQEKH